MSALFSFHAPSKAYCILLRGYPQHFSSLPTQCWRGWIVSECSSGQGHLSAISPFLTLGAKSLLQIQHQECICTCSVAQSCPTLCNPMDCSPPASSVHGIFQARILEWAAISSARGSSHPRDWTYVSCISCFASRQILYHWAIREAPLFYIYIVKYWPQSS